MEITESLIDHLAKLSRLNFTDNSRMEMVSDLQSIVHFVQKLEDLDIAHTDPARWAVNKSDVIRKDIPAGPMQAEDALKNASRHDGKFFEVPKFINK